jgi:hypothetical protein
MMYNAGRFLNADHVGNSKLLAIRGHSHSTNGYEHEAI